MSLIRLRVDEAHYRATFHSPTSRIAHTTMSLNDFPQTEKKILLSVYIVSFVYLGITTLKAVSRFSSIKKMEIWMRHRGLGTELTSKPHSTVGSS